MTRSSSLSPLYDEDFLELVWENGQILVRGGSSSNRTQNNVSITGRTRLSTVYSLLDEFQPHKDTDLRSSSHQGIDQHSCQIDLQFSQSKNSSKLQEELANSSRSSEKDPNKVAGNNNNQLCTYSPSQQCSPSSPLKKPRVDSSQLAPAPATTKSNTQNLGCDQRTGKVNFSNFLIPALCLRSSHHQENDAANQPTKNACSSAREEEIEAGKVEKIPVAAAACISKVPEAFGRNNSALGIQGSHHVQRYNETPSSAAPKAKGIANNTGFCNEPLPACSSVCSLVASNDPKICIRKHEYATDDSTYLSDNDEETEDVVKETPSWEVAGVKRSRNAEIHNLSERKRRDNINEKIRTLKELIPNCNKVDKASTLDDAIDYLKTLKLQLQIMSMGSGLCNPLMMLPAAVNAPPHLPPQLMGAGMCFRPPAGTGFPCSPPQFPIPPLSAITDTTLLNMFGFSNHMRPMPPISHHHAPFINPMNNGNSPPTPPLMPATTTPTNLAEHLANSASLDDLHVKAEYAAAIRQARNQVSLHQHSSSGYLFYFPTGKEENRDVIGQEGRTRKM